MTDTVSRDRHLPTELPIKEAIELYLRRLGIVFVVAFANLVLLGFIVLVSNEPWYVSVLAILALLTFVAAVVIYRRQRNHLPEYRVYWRFLNWVRRIQFLINRERFRIQLSLRESRSRFIKTLFTIISLVLTSSTRIILGALFGFFLLELSRNLQNNTAQPFLSNITQNVPIENVGTYDGILTAVLKCDPVSGQ